MTLLIDIKQPVWMKDEELRDELLQGIAVVEIPGCQFDSASAEGIRAPG